MAVRSHISGSRLLLNGISPQPIPIPINPFEHNCHVLLRLEFLIIYEWLQTSVQTYKRTNGQVNLNKKVSKKTEDVIIRKKQDNFSRHNTDIFPYFI
jgi:hypothetical protein